MRHPLALALMLFTGVVSAQEAPDAAAVVRKAVTAHGGEAALKAFATSSSSGKGTMRAGGSELAFTSEVLFAGPDKFRMTMKTESNGQKLELVQVMNGDKSAQTVNGKAVAIDSAQQSELRQAVVMMDLTTLTPLLTDKYTLKALPAGKSGDAVTSVVVATAAGKGADPRPVTLHFDDKTGYLVRYTREAVAPKEGGKAQKVQEDTTLSDFKKFDGAMVATTAVATHDGKPFMTVTVTAAKALPAIDAKEFAVPAP